MTARKCPKSLISQIGFCPGCGHGIVNRLLCECAEELDIDKNLILFMGVGCSSLQEGNLSFDTFMGSHGGGGASATASKRLLPDVIHVTYQGDGDAYVIGLSQTLNAAYRNENITVITINNTTYGMTGGQMSWTTMPGQTSTTSPRGRDCDLTGRPILIPEIIAQSASFDTAYVARGTVTTPAEINKTKGYITKALKNQMEGKGHSLVEVVSPCPTNWHMDPLDALDFIEHDLLAYYKTGVLKDKYAES